MTEELIETRNGKLFCEISPFTYKISVIKEKTKRYLEWLLGKEIYSKEKTEERLPINIYSHNSLIRRILGNVDLELQENKASNLKLATPRINGIIIKPGETFSFWKLVGDCTKKRGFKEGLIISDNTAGRGIAGGMCQFTNLIHWMVLHSPLDIIEHHHHNGFDLFPDFNRQVPFGTGTSIAYNYLDYQFKNNTDITFQLITYTDAEYLRGELRADKELEYKYHIEEKDMHYTKEGNEYFRNNKIYRKVTDKRTGNIIDTSLIMQNHAKVMYNTKYIPENNLLIVNK